MKNLEWHTASFDQLTLDQLHDMLALRIEVFVIEQDCPYQEIDGLDKEAQHLWATSQGELIACLRVLPPGKVYPESAIGRVVVKKTARGTGLGHDLMRKGIDLIRQNYGAVAIKLSAQEHLKDYYAAHGFLQCGEGYLEDGIPHIPMKRAKSKN